jgi:hypothetical protein
MVLVLSLATWQMLYQASVQLIWKYKRFLKWFKTPTNGIDSLSSCYFLYVETVL